MDIAGVIVAGGLGTRLGAGEKPLAPFDGQTLLDAVIGRVRPQVASLALNVRPDATGAYAHLVEHGLPLIHDPFDGRAGPLGGVIAGLEWIEAGGEVQWLATFPADTPFLPRTIVRSLAAAIPPDSPVPVVADDGGRLQGLCALWPLESLDRLRSGVESGDLRGIQYTLTLFGAVSCAIAGDRAFFNVNTPADLAEAERIARTFESTGS